MASSQRCFCTTWISLWTGSVLPLLFALGFVRALFLSVLIKLFNFRVSFTLGLARAGELARTGVFYKLLSAFCVGLVGEN